MKRRYQLVQVRSYRATDRDELIVPLFVALAVAAGGWAAYRTLYQGKALAPDEALKAQEAYRKRQEEILRRDKKRNVGGGNN